MTHATLSVLCHNYCPSTLRTCKIAGKTGEGIRERFPQQNFFKIYYSTFFENEFLGPSISLELNFSEYGTLGRNK
jgi:hypothetical protein